jgi:arginyl-tRNA synthetase
MNVFAAMLERVQSAAEALAAEGVLPAGLDRTRVTVEPPRDPELGEVTTNVALALAGEAGRAPREIAEAVAVKLRANAWVERAEVGGPGFVNITLQPAVWTQALRAVLVDGNAPADHSRRFNSFHKIPNLTDNADRDAVRFTMLFQALDSARDVDLASTREQSYGNPVFCVQYGHARARATYGRAREMIPDLPDDMEARAALLRDAALERLTDNGERALLRLIGQYPHVQETAAAVREPHRLAMYVHALASAFHTHSRHGIATPHLRFIIQNDRELTVARLALVEAVVIILAAGLALLGIGALDEIT